MKPMQDSNNSNRVSNMESLQIRLSPQLLTSKERMLLTLLLAAF
jgi:hypothetical protein